MKLTIEEQIGRLQTCVGTLHSLLLPHSSGLYALRVCVKSAAGLIISRSSFLFSLIGAPVSSTWKVEKPFSPFAGRKTPASTALQKPSSPPAW